MVLIPDKELTFIVEINGKDLKSVTGRVKGRIQEYIKNRCRITGADFSTHRKEGQIIVKGVPEATLKEALDHARSDLLPYSRFDYEITRADLSAMAEAGIERAEAEEEKVRKQYAFGIKQMQEKMEEERKGYESEIERLFSEIRRLEEENKDLRELVKKEKEHAQALQRSKDDVYAMYEKLTAERVKPPGEACRIWVGDWTKVAERIEDEIAKTDFSGHAKEVPQLLLMTIDDLASVVRRYVPAGEEVPRDLGAIEALANVRPWESTSDYQSFVQDYMRAKEELQFVQDIKEGRAAVPESLRDAVLKTVDVEKNQRIIRTFEEKEKEYKQKSAAAADIQQALTKYLTAEALRGLKAGMSKERPMPVVLICDRAKERWLTNILLPASKGFVYESYMECIERAAEQAGLKFLDEKMAENLVSLSYALPGNVKSWKDASRKQEQLASELLDAFRGCSLYTLGVRMRLTKLMDVPSLYEPLQVALPSDGQQEVQTSSFNHQ